MCGIAGMIGSVDRDAVRHMTQMLWHRGPDDGAVCFADRVGLGHRRLSIIDPSSAGRQPMKSRDGRYMLVFNGEIFNFRELRKELEAKGHVFRSRTDSEVLLYACAEWGESVTERLVGQFAFACWDTERQGLLLARDHLGIKPLYYAEHKGTLYFASEAKAIAAVLPETRSPRLDLLPQYLAFNWVPGEDTMFTGINKLLPGSLLTFRDGRLETHKYWDPVQRWSAAEAAQADPTQRDEEFRDHVRSAVDSQLMSDVPLGLLLSGGIDSTILLAEMHGLGADVRAFTATYPAKSRARDVFNDDLPFARLAAREFSADLVEAELETEVPELLPDAVWHCDEPLADPSTVANLALTRRAREHATVLLTGMGADEITAGYPRYPAAMFGERLRIVPSSMMRMAEKALLTIVNRGVLPIERTRRALYLLKHLGKPFAQRFLGYSSYHDEASLRALLHPDLHDRAAESVVNAFHHDILDRGSRLTPLSRMLAVDLLTFLPYLNLEYMDKTSMANSVEMRVPFLDHRLVEYTMSLPDADKLQNRDDRKVILRRAWKERLPDEILHRPKTGYTPPVRGWMRESLRGYTEDILLGDRALARNIFQPEEIRRLLDRNTAGRADHGMQLWQLLVFEIWMQEYMDGALRKPVQSPDALPDLSQPDGGNE